MDEGSLLEATRWKDCYRWHGDMLADKKRNRAYAEALKQWAETSSERSGRSAVLDIGTGSGLLASLASRALTRQPGVLGECLAAPTVMGDCLAAPTVMACEVVEELHSVASRTFERLQASGQGQVFLQPLTHSLELNIPEKVDLVVGELLDTGLLGEKGSDLHGHRALIYSLHAHRRGPDFVDERRSLTTCLC